MTISIPATEKAPQVARGAVREILGDSEHTDQVLLATSEVVSNAVQHGELNQDDAIDVSVEIEPDRVRVSVAHPGPDFRWDREEPDRDKPGGFGFHILGLLASRWDVAHAHGRTETWFEI